MAPGEPATLTDDAFSEVVGWALKMLKKPRRMSNNVKKYLVEIFNAGVITKQKADAASVAHDMLHHHGPDGRLLFQPSDLKIADQQLFVQTSSH